MTIYSTPNTVTQYIRSTFGNETGYENTLTDIAQNYPFSPSVVLLELNEDRNFAAKIKRKADATNRYQKQICRAIGARIRCSASTPFGLSPTGNIYTKISALTYNGQPEVNPWLGSDIVRDLALTRFRRKLDNLTSQVKAMAPLVEAKELHGLVTQAANLTRDVFLQLHDLKRGNVRNVYRRFSNMWLGLNFGLKPMLKDISDIGTSIANYLSRERQPMQKVSASATREFLDNSSASGIITGYNVQLNRITQGKIKIGYRFVAGVDLTLYSSNDYSIFSQLGLMPANLPTALWELTAFSWAVDYFSTVGAFLEDTFRSDPISTIYVSENRRVEVIGETSYKFVPTNPTTAIDFQRCGVFKFNFVDFNRYPLATLPVRSLRVKSLDEIGLHSVSKLLNLLAVLGK